MVVFWALGGRGGWVLAWFKRWGHGVKVGRYAAAVTVCNGFMQSATLRIADIKNVGRDFAPEELRICP